MASRSVAARIEDATAMFASERDCFVATPNGDGRPNVVPLSVIWHRERFLLCTRRSTRTVANLTDRPFARLVFGQTRDVVLVDAACEICELATVDGAALAAFHGHVGWDIARESPRLVAILCRPETIQSWRQEPEATLMKDGTWVA
jgi:general stress protein 26